MPQGNPEEAGGGSGVTVKHGTVVIGTESTFAFHDTFGIGWGLVDSGTQIDITLALSGADVEVLVPAAGSIASGATGSLAWAKVGGGASFLDLTNPLLPVVLNDGLYAISLIIGATAGLTAGTYFEADFFASSWGSYNPTMNGFAGPAGVPVTVPISTTLVLFAGDTLLAEVTNHDSVSRNFAIESGAFTLIGGTDT